MYKRICTSIRKQALLGITLCYTVIFPLIVILYFPPHSSCALSFVAHDVGGNTTDQQHPWLSLLTRGCFVETPAGPGLVSQSVGRRKGFLFRFPYQPRPLNGIRRRNSGTLHALLQCTFTKRCRSFRLQGLDPTG